MTAPSVSAQVFARNLHAATPRVFVTYVLLALNVIVFGAMLATGVPIMTPEGEDLLRWGANYAPLTTGGEPWRLLTATFVHIGIVHLAMNMVILYQAGPLVERLVGRAGFLVMYVFAGLSGTLMSTAFNPMVISAGASGAVFGVFGCLLAYLLKQRHTMPSEVLGSMARSGLIFVGLNVVLGLQVKGIDIAAHAGGLAGGFLAGLVLAQPLSGPLAELWARRRRGAAVTAVAGALVVAGGVVFMPGAGHARALWRTEQVERQVMPLYNGMVEQARAGKLDDAELARRLRAEVLVPWTALREELDGVDDVPAGRRELFDDLHAYVKARELQWLRLAELLEENDPAKSEESRRHAEEAQAILERMKKHFD